jgi:3-deoxy-D-manno-octulosonic-acid transferase
VYAVAGVLYAPVLLYQAVFRGKNRRGWTQRFGLVPRFDPARRRIWIHAVSLGEINATPNLVAALQQKMPEAEFVFSTTTDTGFARGVSLYGADRVFRFPLDFSFVVRRALHRIRPSLIVLVELEVWYNLVRRAARLGVPVVVVNGRLTGRSARRFRRLGRPVRQMFRDLSWVGAQDETIARRFVDLGTPSDRVEVTSSLKWDSATVANSVPGAEALAKALGMEETLPLWVCGSTGPGEEAIILTAYADLRKQIWESAREMQVSPEEPCAAVLPLLVIVPRKPERFEEVARLIEQNGFSCVRRSGRPDSGSAPIIENSAVVLGDTMGELRKFYSLATVVFVGRTLVPLGGSDPMEVAALGKPILMGPHVDNFASPAAMLLAAGAAKQVHSAEELARAASEMLSAREAAGRMGDRGREVVVAAQGATARTVDALMRLLSGRPERGPSGRVWRAESTRPAG